MWNSFFNLVCSFGNWLSSFIAFHFILSHLIYRLGIWDWVYIQIFWLSTAFAFDVFNFTRWDLRSICFKEYELAVVGVHHSWPLAFEGIFYICDQCFYDLCWNWNSFNRLCWLLIRRVLRLFVPNALLHDKSGYIALINLGERHPMIIHWVKREQRVLLLQELLEVLQVIWSLLLFFMLVNLLFSIFPNYIKITLPFTFFLFDKMLSLSSD